MSNLSFSHRVFKIILLQTHKNQSLFFFFFFLGGGGGKRYTFKTHNSIMFQQVFLWAGLNKQDVPIFTDIGMWLINSYTPSTLIRH